MGLRLNGSAKDVLLEIGGYSTLASGRTYYVPQFGGGTQHNFNTAITNPTANSGFVSQSSALVMPKAGVVTSFAGAVSGGSSLSTPRITLWKARPVYGSSGAVTLVNMAELRPALVGNTTPISIEDSTIDNPNLDAGEVLVVSVDKDAGSGSIWFNLTINIQFKD